MRSGKNLYIQNVTGFLPRDSLEKTHWHMLFSKGWSGAPGSIYDERNVVQVKTGQIKGNLVFIIKVGRSITRILDSPDQAGWCWQLWSAPELGYKDPWVRKETHPRPILLDCALLQLVGEPGNRELVLGSPDLLGIKSDQTWNLGGLANLFWFFRFFTKGKPARGVHMQDILIRRSIHRSNDKARWVHTKQIICFKI